MVKILLVQIGIFIFAWILDAYYFLRVIGYMQKRHKEEFFRFQLIPLGTKIFLYFTPKNTAIFFKFIFSEDFLGDKKLTYLKRMHNLAFMLFITCAVCLSFTVVLYQLL